VFGGFGPWATRICCACHSFPNRSLRLAAIMSACNSQLIARAVGQVSAVGSYAAMYHGRVAQTARSSVNRNCHTLPQLPRNLCGLTKQRGVSRRCHTSPPLLHNDYVVLRSGNVTP
jgi:hypothetical protein